MTVGISDGVSDGLGRTIDAVQVDNNGGGFDKRVDVGLSIVSKAAGQAGTGEAGTGEAGTGDDGRLLIRGAKLSVEPSSEEYPDVSSPRVIKGDGEGLKLPPT